MGDALKEIEVNKESSHLKTASVQLERLLPSQIEQFTQGNSSNCNKCLLTLIKRKRKYQFGEIKDVEVGSRFGTKYEIKVKCVHVSDRNIHHIKVGVLSLIVAPTNCDFGDIISICIPEKRHEIQVKKNKVKDVLKMTCSEANEDLDFMYHTLHQDSEVVISTAYSYLYIKYLLMSYLLINIVKT